MNLATRLTNVKKRDPEEEKARQYAAQMSDKKLAVMTEAFKRLSRDGTPDRLDIDAEGNVSPIPDANSNQRWIEHTAQKIINYRRKHYPLLFPTSK